MSKVEILRAIITDRMTVAVREILAVVEATVSGYEEEVLSLKREFVQKRKLQSVLQPRVRLHRIVLDDSGGAPGVMKKEESQDKRHRFQHKGISSSGGDVDGVASKAELQESDGSVADLPSDDSAPVPDHVEDGEGDDRISDVQVTRSKRRRRLPGRYRSNQTEVIVAEEDSEKNRDNEWKPRSSKARPDHGSEGEARVDKSETSSTQSARSRRRLKASLRKVKTKHVIKLRICLLNCTDGDLSNKVLNFSDSVQTVLCHQNLSESAFLRHLRSTFPELVENKPFQAYLTERNLKRSVPAGAKRMTQTELYRAFRSHQKPNFNFYIKLKEDEETCDRLTNAQTASLNDPRASLDEDAPSQTGEQNMSSTKSEEGDDDEAPEQDNGVEEHRAAEERTRQKALKRDFCKLCGVSFRSVKILTKHALSHLDDPECTCGVCGRRLDSPEELKSHLETHGKLHQCDTCGRYFLTFVTFHKHAVTCQFQRNARDKDTMWTKVTATPMGRPYKCDVCGQAYRFKAQLLIHRSKHTGEEPFRCDVCGKTQKLYASFLQHKLTHSGQKNYSCQHCGKRFYYIKGLRNHERIHKVREKKYLCDICSKAFHSKDLFRQHQRIHGDRTSINCSVCNKLILETELRKHMALHREREPVDCKECGKKFKMEKYLKSHMNLHLGVKPFVCAVCGYRCARSSHLDDHMNTHTGNRPYRCELCHKAFTQEHCLRTHMRSHGTEEQAEEQTEEQSEEQSEEQTKEQTEEQSEEQTKEQTEEQSEAQTEEQAEEQTKEQEKEQAEGQTEEQTKEQSEEQTP